MKCHRFSVYIVIFTLNLSCIIFCYIASLVLIALLLAFRFVCKNCWWVSKAWLSLLSIYWSHTVKGGLIFTSKHHSLILLVSHTNCYVFYAHIKCSVEPSKFIIPWQWQKRFIKHAFCSNFCMFSVMPYMIVFFWQHMICRWLMCTGIW